MGAFEGFLKGFTQTGSTIIQRQDAEDAEMRKIVEQSNLALRNSITVSDRDAENAIKTQKAATLSLQEERAKAKGEFTPSAAPLQMGASDEPSIEDTTSVVAPASAVASAPASFASQVPSIEAYIDVAPGKTAAEIKANAEMKRRSDLFQAQKADATVSKAVKKPVTTAFSEVNKEQEKEELKSAYNARRNFDTYMADLEKTEAAAKNTFSRFGMNLTTGASVLKEAGTKGALAFVSQTKGAISNAEMELFKQASVSEDNPRAFNLTVLAASKAVLLREKQKADFVDAWTKQYGTTDGAFDAFRKFADDNALIAQGKKPGTLVLLKEPKDIAKDTSYLKYLDPNYTKGEDKEVPKGTPSPVKGAELSPAAKALADKFPSLR